MTRHWGHPRRHSFPITYLCPPQQECWVILPGREEAARALYLEAVQAGWCLEDVKKRVGALADDGEGAAQRQTSAARVTKPTANGRAQRPLDADEEHAQTSAECLRDFLLENEKPGEAFRRFLLLLRKHEELDRQTHRAVDAALVAFAAKPQAGAA